MGFVSVARSGSRKSKDDPVTFTKGAGGKYNVSLHPDTAERFAGPVDVLVGTDEDIGTLAIVPGSDYKLRPSGKRKLVTCGRVLTAMGYGPDGGQPANTPHCEWRGDKLVISPAVDAALIAKPETKKKKKAA